MLITDNEDSREPSHAPSPGIGQALVLLFLAIITQPLIDALLSNIAKLGISPDNATSFFLPTILNLMGYNPERVKELRHFPRVLLGAASLLTAMGGSLLYREVGKSRDG